MSELKMVYHFNEVICKLSLLVIFTLSLELEA